MITKQQDNSFINDILTQNALQVAIDWMRNNLSPEEVFEDDQLRAWAGNNGFEIKE